MNFIIPPVANRRGKVEDQILLCDISSSHPHDALFALTPKTRENVRVGFQGCGNAEGAVQAGSVAFRSLGIIAVDLHPAGGWVEGERVHYPRFGFVRVQEQGVCVV